MDLLKYLMDRIKIVERELDKWVPRALRPKILAAATRHLLEAGGKRLRPCLVFLSCEAVGGKAKDVAEAAAAIEILHTFTLIHDDIMDHDEMRRNVKTVHVLWGEPIAIVAGDALFAKVFEALAANVRRLGVDGDTAAKVFDTVSKASFEICRGQTLDLLMARSSNVTEKQYLEMIAGKTGALLEASMRVGAMLGGGTSAQIDLLGEYGMLIGMAFQIRDDILGVTGEQDKLGKPVGSDIKEGKRTLIVIKALERLPPADRRALLKVLGNPRAGDAQIRKAIRLLEKSGAISYASRKANEMVRKAKEKLDGLPETDAKSALLKVADFVISREI
jgi:geranylgeranyl diphosphate synthase type I